MSMLAEINWNGLFRPEIMVFVCFFGFLTIVGVFRAIASAWKVVEKSRIETRLKEQMLAGGYSADDVERVIKATATDTETELTEKVIRAHYDGLDQENRANHAG